MTSFSFETKGKVVKVRSMPRFVPDAFVADSR